VSKERVQKHQNDVEWEKEGRGQNKIMKNGQFVCTIKMTRERESFLDYFY